MKKLLLSVVALMVATLLFSLDDTIEVKDDVSQDNKVEIKSDAETAS
ncbi:MAG: hypothetical protein KJO49_06750 [Bacteroidia bacterium]|nr:hypothetical protein [Bacteroidia bacterium]MBT8269418.1 hypothetical protein [Bacteroidia bacterium]NNF82385.1 hypothetical protein [Flavobacteriaceae bacterium]NNK69491.1 hypothetical protein [Flavobacteriaceae bacterium]NNL80053.1 hypothetical protein [Flavobacteriaceae bacterium]